MHTTAHTAFESIYIKKPPALGAIARNMVAIAMVYACFAGADFSPAVAIFESGPSNFVQTTYAWRDAQTQVFVALAEHTSYVARGVQVSAHAMNRELSPGMQEVVQLAINANENSRALVASAWASFYTTIAK